MQKMPEHRLRIEKVNENFYKVFCLKIPARFEVTRNAKGQVSVIGLLPEYGPPGFEMPYLHNRSELDESDFAHQKALEIEKYLRGDNREELERLQEFY